MKVQVQFEKFKKEINKALNACMKNGSNQNLKGIYIEALDGSLTIRSTNIDIGFESSIICKVETEGKFLIQGDVLSRLLSTVNTKSNSTCSLTIENNLCNIEIEQHIFNLKTLNFDVFPNLPTVTGVDIDVEKGIFLSGLKSVLYSVAKSEIKPEISGVFVKFINNNIFFVATDAYRLVEKKTDHEIEFPELSFILPANNIKDILRILESDENKTLKLTISTNSLQIKEENTWVISRLIDGNFPNYTQIIPNNPESFAIFLKEDLVKSLRITSFFSDKTQQINLNIGEESTEMEANNIEVGNTKEKVNSTLKGTSFSVKINSKYLEEFLQNTSDSSIILKYTAQNKAIIVQGIQDANYTYLLMPSYR